MKILNACLIASIACLTSNAQAQTYRWLTLFCATKGLPTTDYTEKVRKLTSLEFPGVGHFYKLGTSGRVILDFDTIVSWYKNEKGPENYPDPIGDLPRRDLSADCIRTAYDQGYFQAASQRPLSDFDGVFLVNDMPGATAVTWYEEYLIEVVMKDGAIFKKPVIMSDLNHLNQHNVLAHEMGHGFGIYHAGSGFDPMGFGNIWRTPTTIGFTHSFFIGMHRRFAGWTDLKNTTLVNEGESQRVWLSSVADFLTGAHPSHSIIEAIVNKPTVQYSVEYRRFLSYDAHIAAEGVTIHKASESDGKLDLRLNDTLSFPFSSHKTIPEVLLMDDSFVDPQAGLVVRVSGVDFSGRWQIEIINNKGPLKRHPYPDDRAHEAPGRIEAEDFDRGYNTWTSYDRDPGNNGGAYRLDEAVDIEPSRDSAGGSFNVGWIQSKEFLDYTIAFPKDGTYVVKMRLSNPSTRPSKLTLKLDDNPPLEPILVTATGDWHQYSDFSSKPFRASAGVHILRVNFDEIVGVNFNWFDVELSQ